MVLLVILALIMGVVWLYVQTSDLSARLARAEQRLGRLTASFEDGLVPDTRPAPPTPRAKPDAISSAPKVTPPPGSEAPTLAAQMAAADALAPRVVTPNPPRGPTREQVAAWLSENGL